MPTLEVLAHRVIWSVPVALAVLVGARERVMAALRNPRLLGMAALTAAADLGQLVDLSLGDPVRAMRWRRRWDITSTRWSAC